MFTNPDQPADSDHLAVGQIVKIQLGEISWSEEQTSLAAGALDHDKEVVSILLLLHLLFLDERCQNVLRVHDVGDLLFVLQF